MRDIEISNAARALIDAPYALGDASGFDCISMLFRFYNSLNIRLPHEFKGFVLHRYNDDGPAENYAEKWMNGEGREEIYDYLMSLGQEVGVNYIIGGDLLIFQSERWAFPGIYLGGGHFLAAYERGVMCCPLKMFKHALVGSRRLA